MTCPSRWSARATSLPYKLRIVSANLANGRADSRAFADLVSELRPDVLALQELSPRQSEALEALLPHGRLEPQRRSLGMGIAALRPAVCEHLPLLANISDQFCVVRTMTHTFNDHSGGGHYIQTGHRWHVPIGGGFSPTPKDWPAMGSIVEYVDQHTASGPAPPSAPKGISSISRAGSGWPKTHRNCW